MAWRGIRARIAQHVAENPGGWGEAAAHWIGRLPHEEDFYLFDALADVDGLVLDIGANRGQSAISVLRRTRRLRVLSLEPNRTLRPALLSLAMLHPVRFRFRLLAAGAAEGEATLRVPRGRRGEVSTEASLAASEFERPLVRDRLARRGVDTGTPSAFRCLRVPVVAADSLGVSPDLVKLDVEGYEREALLGLLRTLDRCRPALLIELNAGPTWMPLLEERGYRFYRYDRAARRLQRLVPPEGVLNLVALHPKSESGLCRRLWRLAQGATDA